MALFPPVVVLAGAVAAEVAEPIMRSDKSLFSLGLDVTVAALELAATSAVLASCRVDGVLLKKSAGNSESFVLLLALESTIGPKLNKSSWFAVGCWVPFDGAKTIIGNKTIRIDEFHKYENINSEVSLTVSVVKI